MTQSQRRKTTKLALAALFAALTAVGAFLKFPLGATYVTLQFFFTALSGILLGAKWGAISQLVYLALGLLGLPVFAQGGGLGYVLIPSFGFLLGLPVTAWVTGKLAGCGGGRGRIFFAALMGLLALYLVGVPYLYCILNFYLGKNLTFFQALTTGMLIYLPGDALKLLALMFCAPPLLRALDTM